MNWWRRRGWEQRMKSELRFHVDSRTQDYIAEGFPPEEAASRAHQEFGSLELAKDECRDHKPAAWIDNLARDVRYAFRSLNKSRGFTSAAIITLTLGIGANAAIFQLIDAVRLRTLPVPDPQSLATLQLASRTGWRGGQYGAFPALTNPQWERLRSLPPSAFSGLLAWSENVFGLDANNPTRLALGLFVSGNFFHVLDVQPLMGRLFASGEDKRGCGIPGAVISYAFWQREFGRDPAIIGRKITLNEQPVEVIGVTPAGFTGLDVGASYDVAVPICSQAVLWSEGNWLDKGTVWWLNVMGRLKPGASIMEANAQLRTHSASLFRLTLPPDYPPMNVQDYLKFKLVAIPAGTGQSGLREEYGQSLLLLLATSGFVLLIACANLANLILARAVSRAHEFAVRMAIGASRRRLIRQVMVENGLLAVAGAVCGIALALALSRFLVSMIAGKGNWLFLDLRPDPKLFAFATGLATLTCLLFGLAPALQATRPNLSNALKSAGRSLSASRDRFELRQLLVAAQVALALVLLVGSLLFSGSLRNLLSLDPGFDRNGVTVSEIDFRRLRMRPPQRLNFKQELLQKIRIIPGVVSAGEIDLLPLDGGSSSNMVWREGNGASTFKAEVNFDSFGEGYLKTMGIRLLAGRDFNNGDHKGAPKVALVNQTFARRLGMGTNPIGARFIREATPSEPEQVFEVVGLVRDTKYRNLREEFQPIAFLSIYQDGEPGSSAQIVIRSSLPPQQTTAAVRDVLVKINPMITTNFHSYATTVEEGLLRERLMATLSGFFGVVGALISAVGLYGVMSYLVARRTNEIGVRIALGATASNIVALVFRQIAVLLVFGLAMGAILAFALGGTAQSLLFGIKPFDVSTLALATALLIAVAALASYLPARRASHVEPLSAIREE